VLNRNEMIRHRRQMQRRISDVVAERRMALLDVEDGAEEPAEPAEQKPKQECAA
jgi:hypothetical protein